MDTGRVHAKGTHEELTHTVSVYRKLMGSQMKVGQAYEE